MELSIIGSSQGFPRVNPRQLTSSQSSRQIVYRLSPVPSVASRRSHRVNSVQNTNSEPQLRHRSLKKEARHRRKLEPILQTPAVDQNYSPQVNPPVLKQVQHKLADSDGKKKTEDSGSRRTVEGNTNDAESSRTLEDVQKGGSGPFYTERISSSNENGPHAAVKNPISSKKNIDDDGNDEELMLFLHPQGGDLVERKIDDVWFPAIILGSSSFSEKEMEGNHSRSSNDCNSHPHQESSPSYFTIVYLDDSNFENNVPAAEVRFPPKPFATLHPEVTEKYSKHYLQEFMALRGHIDRKKDSTGRYYIPFVMEPTAM